MTILRFILLAYGFLSIFIAGGLFFKRSGAAYLSLSCFALLFGLEIMDFLYSTSSLIYTYPWFYGRFYFITGFLYGPVLWFHFRSMTSDNRFYLKDVLHFLPVAAVVAFAGDILVMPDDIRRTYMWEHFEERIMPLNYARAAHILVYGILFVTLIVKNYGKLDQNKRLYAVTICSVYFVTAVFVSWLTEYATGWRQFIYYYLGTSTIVVTVGWVLYKEPEFLATIRKKYFSSTLTERQMQRIKSKIRHAYENEKIYLNSDLNLAGLAAVTGEKTSYLSRTFSELINESFNDYTNRFRIKHAKQMLADKNFNHYKIEAVALECGFNNKVTFNKAFSKFTSQTPSSYRKQKEQVRRS